MSIIGGPTDEQVERVDSIWRTEHYPVRVRETGQIRCACGEAEPRDRHRIRVTLASAGGNDA